MSDDEIPDLEDFSTNLHQFEQKQTKQQIYIGDYSLPKEQQYLEEKQNKNSQMVKQEPSLDGFKKGFLLDNKNKKVQEQSNQQQKQSEYDIVKSKEIKQNPLEIKEVQQNMNQPSNVAEYLTQSKEKWLSQDLLNNIQSNEKLQKLFSNPEYMQAIQMMQSKPKETMLKYQNNPEFIMLFQEFAKTMGEHFSNLDPKIKEKQDKQIQQPRIQEVKQQPKNNKKKSQEEVIQEIIQNDQEVVYILKDPKVMAFIEYLQKTGKVDFHRMVQADPELGKKLRVLIQKGVLNIQGA